MLMVFKPLSFQNQNMRKHYKKTGAGPLPIRNQLDSLDLIILEMIGEEPVTGIPNIRRAPVFPGEDELMVTLAKKKLDASESRQGLKDSVLTPSLTRRKISYNPAAVKKLDKGGQKKSLKKKKNKKHKYKEKRMFK